MSREHNVPSVLKILDAWTFLGPTNLNELRTHRIELFQYVDRTYGVRLLIEGDLVDEEWFPEPYDAIEYAHELRRSAAPTNPGSSDEIADGQEWIQVNQPTDRAGIEALSSAIGHGRVDDVLRVLKAAGLT
jgi:hypothetical protein